MKIYTIYGSMAFRPIKGLKNTIFSLCILCFCVVLFLSCCLVHNVGNQSSDNTTDAFNIIRTNLENFTHLQPYSPSMKSGDTFFLTVSPGIFLSPEDLNFSTLSGLELLGNPKAIDQAYRFAKLANKILIAGVTYHETGQNLGNLYTGILQSNPTENYFDSESMQTKHTQITSSTYNDEFFLTFANSKIKNQSEQNWSNYLKLYHHATQSRRKKRKLFHKKEKPSHYISRFSAHIKTFFIQRPWFYQGKTSDLKKSAQLFIDQQQPMAIITGLILAKDLNVSAYFIEEKKPCLLKLDEVKHGDSVPSVVLESKESIVLGIICTVL